MKLTKVIALLCALFMLFAFVGCPGPEGNTTQNQDQGQENQDPNNPPPPTRLSIYAAKGDPVLPSGTKKDMPKWSAPTSKFTELPDFITALNGKNTKGEIVQTNTKTTNITNVTPALKAALKEAQETPGFFDEKPRNVIVIIGDGMGEPQLKMSREYKGELIMDSIAIHRSADHRAFAKGEKENADKKNLITTDSCAGGTAILSGYKTRYGYIGMDRDANQIPTLAELGKKLGKKIGCVTNDCTTDATPADTLCHSTVRSSGDCLDIQDAIFGADVVIGGYTGIDSYAKDGKMLEKIAAKSGSVKAWDMTKKMSQTYNVDKWWAQYKSGDNGNMFAKMVFGDDKFFADKDQAWFTDYFAGLNYSYATTMTAMLTAAKDPSKRPIMNVGQAAPNWDEGKYEMGFLLKSTTYPSYPEMVAYTISVLEAQDIADENTDGFFCMLENTNPDGWGHLNVNCIKETGSPAADGGTKIKGENIKAAFIANEVQNTDEGVAIAIKYVLEHPDTLLIVTADHDTGGLMFEKGWEDDYECVMSSTDGHSSAMVPVFALGAGAELFTKDMNGADIDEVTVEQIKSSNVINNPDNTNYINYFTGAKIGELMGDPNFGCRQSGDPRFGGYAD